MDQPLPALDAVVRPWRTAALVAGAVAVVELVVLLAAGVALLGKPLSQRARDAAVTRELGPLRPGDTPRIGSSTPSLARGETSVLVLNGNGRTGAAAEQASRVRALGYLIGGTGNATRTDYSRSLVMYRPGLRGEALRLARDLRLKIVGPLDGMRTRDLLGAHLALVVGD